MTSAACLANMPRMQSFPELLKYVWQRLGSMSLAIILLVVLAIASVIGTVLLQNQDQADYLQQFGPLWYWVFRSLGLFDMYHTWWFLTILGFLMLSVSACLWRNVPKMLKEMRARKPTLSEKALKNFKYTKRWQLPASTDIAPLQASFEKRLQGWEFRPADEGGRHYIRADKGRWHKWGYILVHSAILVVLIGGWMGAQYGFRGNMAVPEGKSEKEISFLQGTETGHLVMPFQVRCNSFFIDFYPTGAPKEFRSNLTIIDDGKEVLTSDIIVNEPLYYKGVRIYQASFGDGGSDITFKMFHMDGSEAITTATSQVYKTWKDPASGIELKITDFKPYNVENMANPGEAKNFQDLGPAVEYEMRGPGLKPVKIKAFMNPFIDGDGNNQGSFMMISLTGDAADFKPVALGLDLSNPVEWKLFHAFMRHLVAATSGGKQTKEANLAAFKAAMNDVFGEGNRPEGFQAMAMRTLQAVNMLPQLPWPLLPMLGDFKLHYYTGLQLALDPGMNVVWVGSALLVLGLCIMFYMPHRKLWLIIQAQDDGMAVTLAGMANRNHLVFDKDFHDLFTKLDDDFAKLSS
ncbi:MAG: cytochrome c biogenesis protein [Zetaproteobacteria bacterium CG12_big_fil_rev_8_21_14_0_65_54_13]|nr:MAG: cytochrome c biogenesis protein [Zetaproteobacteria bacterium CG23_combo_of_CG06-09_8_20_14_all_54_7]PIW46762.1 MAG: cytochrome c biogenesis protein [Zetaproteobacteria bacterium CG12_big_fil_rev_8_21_14_0_65_54_13]PIX53444.1 MAG: cytochrome c biogenesis protein [Zetaproteobacteria bacterium CG_4_10_14_3_um_filter_54_28]PJA29173.1 MAG: cytochrome c biogenesis protein [Zetaproteobacteria bacterium CG_4_9_14_3_um_filter_54_145]